MSSRDFPTLDQLDIQIMEELESDPRRSYKNIAARLGVSRPTLMSRLQRLLDGSVVRKLCWVDPMTIGHKFIITLDINTQPDQVTAVADRLASYGQIINVYLSTGSFDIGAAAHFRNRTEMSSFLTNDLGSIPGIVHVEKMVILQEVKAGLKLLAKTNIEEVSYFRNPEKDPVNLDDVDMKLIRELNIDPTQKPSHLAHKLGVSKATALRRFQRLEDEHVIQIITAVNPFALGYEGIATIGLKCDPDKIMGVANKVASFNQVSYIALCAGRYDVLIWVVFQKLSLLKHFIVSELGNIPGLKSLETAMNYKSVKAPLYRIPM